MKTHKAMAMAIAIAVLGLSMAGTSSAWAGQNLQVEGNAVIVPPNGYLYCKVTVSSRRAAELTVTLLDATGAPIDTEFGTEYSASPIATDDGRYLAEVTAGAFGDPAQSVEGGCRALVQGRLGRDVQASIDVTAYDQNGNLVQP